MEDKPLYGDVLRGLFRWTADAKSGDVPAQPAPTAPAADSTTVRAFLPQLEPRATDDEDELHRLRQATAIMAQLETLDRHGDGMIGCEELVGVLKALDTSACWTEGRIHDMLKMSDIACDGSISLNAFIDWTFGDAEHSRDLRLRLASDSAPLEGALQASRDAEGSDGEGSELDVPALVRLRSATEFGNGDSA